MVRRFQLLHSPVRHVASGALLTKSNRDKIMKQIETITVTQDQREVVDTLLKCLPHAKTALDDQAVRILCENVSTSFVGSPQVLLLAARCCVAANRSGSVTSLLPVYGLLELILPDLHQRPNIQVVRAIRVASEMEWTSVTEALFNEALKKTRVCSYSAMDISELIHSANMMYRKCIEQDNHERVELLMNTLFNEVVARRHSIIIKNEISSKRHVRAMRSQDLSFIASSNILFVLRDIGNISCRNVLRDILRSRETCEDDAFLGSPLLHLVSVCDSLLFTASSESRSEDWKVHKRILKAIDHKLGAFNAKNPFFEECVRKLEVQYGPKKIISRFIS
jgi:hypothetical protein